MEKLKRLTIFAIIVACSVLLFPKKTNAWTGDLPVCGTTPLQWQWKQKVKEKYNLDIDAYQGVILIASFDNVDSYPSGYTGTVFDLGVYFAPSGSTIIFDQSFSTKTVSITPASGNVKYFGISKDQSDTTNYQKNLSASAPSDTTITNVGSFGCISSAKGATYSSSWTGMRYIDGTPQEVANCTSQAGLAKITCQTSNVFQGIANTFIDVGKSIVNGIANLFIPSSIAISNTFTGASDFFQAKLGMLLLPVTFLVNTFNAWFTGGAGQDTGFASNATFFGSNFSVGNFSQMETAAPTLLAFIKLTIQIVTVSAFVWGIHYKLQEVLQK